VNNFNKKQTTFNQIMKQQTNKKLIVDSKIMELNYESRQNKKKEEKQEDKDKLMIMVIQLFQTMTRMTECIILV